MSDTLYDVRQEQYPAVIREMIKHEDGVTNDRIMWLLVGEGFISNAYASMKIGGASTHLMLELAGLLVALSAFVMLYQSYQARGYLRFLGQQAKKGTLREEHLPLVGWPRNRIKGWYRSVWFCPWFRQASDLFEPWLLLPFLFTSMCMTGLLHVRSSLNLVVALTLGVILSAVILSLTCVVLVWSQSEDDQSTEE